MKQPKYSPQEALERVKLMMKYDTSKTLTENVKTSKQPLNEIAPLMWVAGVALAAAPLASLGTWIYSVQGGGDSFAKTKGFLEGCSSQYSKLKPTQSRSEHREAAEAIYNAITGAGTDEDAIKSALGGMKTVADLCELNKYYTATYGDLFDDLDGDIDGEDFRKYVWSAIAPKVADAIEDLEKVKTDDGGKIKKDEKVVTARVESKYKSCSGTYSLYCKSPKIGEVQSCLGGLKVDNAFGPATASKLKEKGFGESFTDSDVAKICSKSEPNKPEISGEVGSIGVEEL